MNDLTVIIVSWNCRGDLADCLRSMKTEQGIAYPVIVVDNNSRDGTVEMLRRDFQEVQVIANAENAGFAAANNQGLSMGGSRYALLLNPDTVVHPGAFDALVRFMDANPGVWAAGPAMLNRDGSPQRSGVRFPNTWNILCEALFLDRLFPRSRLFGRHKELYADGRVPRAVDYVQGSCIIVRREPMEKVGGLDEQFFMYFEEADWCYRMKEKGGQVYFVPGAKVTHVGGGEAGHYDETRLVHYHRSLLLFYRKHYPPLSALLVRLVIVMRSFIRILVWTAVAIGRPGLRSSALSSIRGYLHIPAIVVEHTA